MCKECDWQRKDHKEWISLLYAPDIGKSYRIFFQQLNTEGFALLTHSGWDHLRYGDGSSCFLAPSQITHWLPL